MRTKLDKAYDALCHTEEPTAAIWMGGIVGQHERTIVDNIPVEGTLADYALPGPTMDEPLVSTQTVIERIMDGERTRLQNWLNGYEKEALNEKWVEQARKEVNGDWDEWDDLTSGSTIDETRIVRIR